MQLSALFKSSRQLTTATWILSVLGLFWVMAGFIRHSAGLGLAGLIRDLTDHSPFYAADAPLVTFIMFLHMMTPLRRKWPKIHRKTGYLMIGLGVFTAIGAMVYAIFRSTTGGLFMDISSSVYGILMIWAAVQTYRFGRRKRWPQHRRWGIRFSVLVIASWLYRVHYIIWDHLTGGIWTTPDMTGPFDKFQAWAFFLSYLLLAELFFLWEGHKKRAARQRRPPAASQTGLTAQ